MVLASAVFYLLIPLKFGWARPESSGWTAPLFHELYANDLPFNLAPSLHISLRSLIWVAFAAHLRGWLRTVVKVWFIIVGISTLLIWQHHLIDVVEGFLMGWFCWSAGGFGLPGQPSLLAWWPWPICHCQPGLFRSAAVTAAWLVKSGTVPDHAAAVALIHNLDPRVRLS